MWLLYTIVGACIGGWYMLYLVVKEASRTLIENEDEDIKDMEEHHKRLNRK